MNGDKIKDLITKNMGYLAAAFVALVYIATSMITLRETGKSFAKIIGDGATSFFMGVLLTHVFSLQGILRGKRDDQLLATERLHGEQVVAIAPIIDRLDGWCEGKTAEALRRERTKILARNAMRYDDYFEDDGIAKPFVFRKCETRFERARERERYRAYRRAVTVKITPLLAGTLTGGGEKASDPHDLGPDLIQYEGGVVRRKAVSQILLAVVFGYYAIDLIVGFSYAELIWKTFQVGIYCVMGVIQQQQSYLFVVDQYRRRIVRLIDRLQEFESAIKAEKTVRERKENEHGRQDRDG